MSEHAECLKALVLPGSPCCFLEVGLGSFLVCTVTGEDHVLIHTVPSLLWEGGVSTLATLY